MGRHRGHRADHNQPEIVKALRQVGIEVHVIDRPVDLLCGFHGRWILLEVKDEKGTLTPDQIKFFDAEPKGPTFVVRSIEEAISVVRNDQLKWA